jgi:uncharacterized protein DUF2630
MDDKSVLTHIHDLVAEEKRLRASSHSMSPDDRRRLDKIQVELNQYWDLLRQRRAREEFGDDPNTARERSVNEVEGYLQ